MGREQEIPRIHGEDLDPSERLIPRLPSSKTWTEIPAEFAAKVHSIFSKQFLNSKYKVDGEFVVEGRIYPDEEVLRIGFLEAGRLRQINFEASMDVPLVHELQDVDPEGDTIAGAEQSVTMDRLYTCIDILGSLIEEYFEKGSIDEIDIPRSWQPFEFETETVYLQYSTVNSRLEEEADRILGLIDDSPLVHD